MVSPALSQLLERARARFGLDVEVLDAGLKCVYPEGGSDLGRMIQDSPSIRRALLDALAGARPERLRWRRCQLPVLPVKAITQTSTGGGTARDTTERIRRFAGGRC